MSIHRSVLKPTAVAALLALTVGCASVPDMESRLQSLRLDPWRYRVQSGDTIESVSARYLLQPGELSAMNPGLSEPLAAGTEVVVRPLPQGEWDETLAQGDPSTQHREGPLREVPVVEPVTMPAAVQPLSAQNQTVAAAPEAVITEIPAVSRGNAPLAGSAEPQEEIISEAQLEAELGPPQRLDTLRLQPPVAAPTDLIPNAAASAQAGVRTDAGAGTHSIWTWPIAGQIARSYSPQRPDGQGIDIAGAPGQDIHAARNGTVRYSGRDLSGKGNLVIIEHEDALMSTYAHAAQLYVAENDVVRSGDPIATLGSNDQSESVLHFEIRHQGQAVDPTHYLPNL